MAAEYAVRPAFKILVVADPVEQRELVAALRASGEPMVSADILAGDGDDDTYGQFVARQPAVVVIRASLDAGDALALIGAMREADPAVFVVLVGDEHGPVRTALDAVELGVERF